MQTIRLVTNVVLLMVCVAGASGCAAKRVSAAPPAPSSPPPVPSVASPAPDAPAPHAEPHTAPRADPDTESEASTVPSLRGRTQLGFATFLAPSFHGKESASGEIFNQRELVAAHRTLPFGSIVRVTNLKNGRSVTVRIVDRGPYGKNYREGTIIDLSRAAARRVGMLTDGQVRVRVIVLRLGDES